MFGRLAATALVCLVMATSAAAQEPSGRPRPEAYVAPAPLVLEARMTREFDAPEARQGVAVDRDHFYAVVNTVIGRYDKRTGEFEARWMGPRDGLVRHINSCFAERQQLWCANSNFPETPMGSSIEVFDTQTMQHVRSHSLGMLDEGSLTFFDRLGGGWIAGFAHYNEIGGLEYKDARFAGLVLYDPQWRRTGGYMLPASVLDRMSPHAASGGAIGPDGLLYLFGHDRPEMYVLARPNMGPTLLHVATIAVDAAGQAFSWDRTSRGREIYTINRPTGAVRVFEVPSVSLDGFADAVRF
jgi:hypothetical protein